LREKDQKKERDKMESGEIKEETSKTKHANKNRIIARPLAGA